MKLLLKILLTIAVTGLAWVGDQYSLMALNRPNTAMVLLGILGFTLSIFVWCAVINRVWNLVHGLKSLVERIGKKHDA